MVRPVCCRRIGFAPGVRYFKPRGIPLTELEEVILGMDELEAVRLADLEGLYQEQAAERMEISRQTFGRIIEMAHRKISDALVNGKALRIEGGEVMFQQPGGGGAGGGGGRCRGGGMRRGRKGGMGGGPAGSCVCPSCGQRVAHSPGVPCASLQCPKCGTPLARE